MKNYLFIIPKKNMDIMPSGIAYVAGSLKNHNSNYQIYGLNLDYEPDIYASIENSIQKNKIDIVCITGLSPDYTAIHDLIRFIKKIAPRIIIIIGGGLVTTEPELIISNIGADFGIIGQGEVTICELADALSDRSDISKVDGLIYLDKNGKILKTGVRKEIEDLDGLPYPLYEIFNLEQYVATKKGMDIIASRSCPFYCTFCYHPSGTKYRQRSVKNVIQEIKYWINNYTEIKQIGIGDELFATSMQRVKEFCEELSKLNIMWSAQLRVDKISEEMLLMMKKSGCTAISYGIESADNRILKSMNKHITIEQIENALYLTKKVGIFIQGNFIFGDIEEDKDSVDNTLTWWKEHAEYGINMGMIRVLPGSKLYDYAIQNGIIKEPLEFIKQGCPFINVSKLSDSEYNNLQIRIEKLNVSDFVQICDLEIEKINEDNTCNVLTECIKCKGMMKFENIKINEKMDSFYFCKHCFSKLRISPANICPNNMYLDILSSMIDEKMQECLDKKQKVAIWGAGERAEILLLSSKNLRECTKIIIDTNSTKYNAKLFNEFNIGAPALLKELDIDCAIVATSKPKRQTIVNLISEISNRINIINI